MIHAEHSVGGSVVLAQDNIYDAFIDRIATSVSVYGGTAVTTSYAYDLNSVGSGITRNVNNLWAELDASGNIAIRYFNGAGANNHVARTGSGIDNAWLLSDRQGSIRTLTNLYGNKAKEIDYDSCGNITRNQDSVPFAMTLGATRAFGYYYDSQLSLSLALNRWYDSANGVWITEDPICGALNSGRIRCQIIAVEILLPRTLFSRIAENFGDRVRVERRHSVRVRYCAQDVVEVLGSLPWRFSQASRTAMAVTKSS